MSWAVGTRAHVSKVKFTSGSRPRSFRPRILRSLLYGWGRGDYQKEGRGVSGVSLQVLIFYIGILNMVN